MLIYEIWIIDDYMYTKLYVFTLKIIQKILTLSLTSKKT